MEREKTRARRISLVPAALALAACLWASPGNGQETAAQPGDGGAIAAADLREQALAAMEAMREEIVTLTALRDAQAALLAWNRGTPWSRGSPLVQRNAPVQGITPARGKRRKRRAGALALRRAVCRAGAGGLVPIAAGDLRLSDCGRGP